MGFKIENEFKAQGQSSPKLIGIYTVLKYIFDRNLELVTSIGDEQSCGQAQNKLNFDFKLIWLWRSKSIIHKQHRC